MSPLPSWKVSQLADLWTPAALTAFEADIATAVDAKSVPGPVHLSGGNEGQLIAYFAAWFRPGDWVFTSWRSHYHCLLAGVPPDLVRERVLAGKSITLCFPDYKLYSSAIVAGQVSHALGVAMQVKRDPERYEAWFEKMPEIKVVGSSAENAVQHLHQQYLDVGIPIEPYRAATARSSHVHCFLGDMAARTGAFHEAREYAVGHDLPITFICENNFKSVTTDTQEAWGSITSERVIRGSVEQLSGGLQLISALKTVYYEYDLSSHWPHSGAAKRTNF